MGFTAYERRWIAREPRVPAELPPLRPFDRAAALRAFERVTKTQVHQPDWSKAGLPHRMSREEGVFWLYAMSSIGVARSAVSPSAVGMELDAWVERLRTHARAALEQLDLAHTPDTATIAQRLAALCRASWSGESHRVTTIALAAVLDLPALLELIIDEANDAAASDAIRRGQRERENAQRGASSMRVSAVTVTGGMADAAEIAAAVAAAEEALRAMTEPGIAVARPLLPAPDTPYAILWEEANQHRAQAAVNRSRLHMSLAAGFAEFVAPYLDDAAFAEARAAVRPALRRALRRGLAHDDFTGTTTLPFACFLAASLHLTGDVEDIVAALHDDIPAARELPFLTTIVYGLATPERIVETMRTLAVPLKTPAAVRDWLATTGEHGLDYARAQIAEHATEETFDAFADAVGALDSPLVPQTMLRLTAAAPMYVAARAWLETHVDAALPVLAAERHRATVAGQTANEILTRLARRGHAGAAAAPAFGDRSELAWLDDAPRKNAKPLRWLYADALPPLVVGGAPLDEPRVAAVIEALRASTLQAPDARVRALERHADAASAEHFALALFGQWLRAGANARDKWALYAVGLLGGDAAATALAPYVRRWPGESQHARAVVGLECLRRIGSDVALTQIAGLAQKLSFAALKRRANVCLEEIAKERNLTRERLEDRIVPSLDLDGGERRFVFDDSTYTASVNAALEPVLRDANGKTVRDLPKRAGTETADDDDVRAEWKLFKKQLRDVAAVQRGRLEAAMVAQRSWAAGEFARLLVAHPVLGPLVRQLVWIAEAPGAAPLLLRVRDDGTTVDAGDVPVVIPASASIRLVHRLELDERVLDAWETRFAALRVTQPFAQLDRVTYRLDEIELASDGIHRFDGNPVPEPAVIGRLRARGWQRGQPEDGGAFMHHWKRFERAGLTAIVQHEMIVVGYVQPDARIAIEGCFFVRGPAVHRARSDELVPLRDVPAVPLSEVCADCAYVLA